MRSPANHPKRQVEKRKMNSAPGKPGKPLKITAVGDGMVGKTCLLITYTTKTFPTKYVPTVFDNFADSLTVDGQEYNTTLWDTAGQEDYERLRPLSYTHTDCFLLCFSVNNRTSYDNIQSKWCPELKHHCPNVPIILVGTKSDLRDDPNVDCLTPSDGRKLRRKIKALKYMECSAIKQENLKEIFVEAVRACVKTKVDANCICC
uniref:Ras-like GTP-binding protein RhoL n=1 Tax=Lygus hesperus TaxID=30085 RepID=A0A0A9XI07_LYGHE